MWFDEDDLLSVAVDDPQDEVRVETTCLEEADTPASRLVA
jgi:hypothetical protein